MPWQMESVKNKEIYSETLTYRFSLLGNIENRRKAFFISIHFLYFIVKKVYCII